jgi:hypothetical protein
VPPVKQKGKAKPFFGSAGCKAHFPSKGEGKTMSKSASHSYFASKSTSDPADKTNRFLSAKHRGLDNIIKYYFKPLVLDQGHCLLRMVGWTILG